MELGAAMSKRTDKKKRRKRRLLKRTGLRRERNQSSVDSTPNWNDPLDWQFGSRPLVDNDRIGPDLATAKYSTLSEPGKSLALINVAKDLFDIREVNGLPAVNRALSPDEL